MEADVSEVISDQVWFITGASSGLGLALSRAVLARGGRVAVAVRSPNDPTVAALTDLGKDRVCVVRLDVTHAEEVQAGIDHAVAQF
ncbi:SDR family NAD(P)-dependent oxidoreductase [Streptomyces sp. NPDC005900]|uniref:SDR family NAD(P)-dependent oxidoreductase n=1 Tax=Streptomyces sp. NPDC005900 TaxID=3154569 RepID=UPI0033CA206E